MDEEFGPAATAIYVGDLDVLAGLLSDDPRLATRQSSCSHPTLLQLVACEEPKIVDPVGAARLLVDAGAETWSPLVSAAGCNSRAVMEFFLDRGVTVNRDDVWTPLDEALYWSQRDMVALLIDRGAEVSSLRAAAGLGDVALVERFFSNGALAAEAGPIRSPFPDTVPLELADDHSAIIDHAFVMAVNNSQAPTARQLEAHGARVNEKPPGYHWRGTALHAAAWRGDQALVAWLLSVGADPHIRDGLVNSDAIGWANHHEHPEVAAQIASHVQRAQ